MPNLRGISGMICVCLGRSVRCDRAEHVQVVGQLEGRVSDPGVAARAGELPVRAAGEQGGPGAAGDLDEEGAAVVSDEEQHALLRDVREGGPERGPGLPVHSAGGAEPAEFHRRFV